METAATKIARLDRSLARTGETVTLQRTSVDGTTGAVAIEKQLSDCPAHVRASAPQDIDMMPGVAEIRVTLSPTYLLSSPTLMGLLNDDGTQLLNDDGMPLLADEGSPIITFGIPQKDDRILIQGDPSNIETVSPIYYGGQLVRVNLLCRG